MTADEPTSREEQRLETRKRILQTATALFKQQGMHSVSTDQIAKEVGVSKGTIFHHFTNKENLINEVLNHAFILFFQEIADQLHQQPLDKDYLKVLSKDFFKEMIDNPGLIKLMLDYSMGYIEGGVGKTRENENRENPMKNLFSPIVDTIKGILIEMGVSEDKANLRTHLFLAGLDGIGLYLFLDLIPNDQQYIDHLIDEFIDMIIEGTSNE